MAAVSSMDCSRSTVRVLVGNSRPVKVIIDKDISPVFFIVATEKSFDANGKQIKSCEVVYLVTPTVKMQQKLLWRRQHCKWTKVIEFSLNLETLGPFTTTR